MVSFVKITEALLCLRMRVSPFFLGGGPICVKFGMGDLHVLLFILANFMKMRTENRSWNYIYALTRVLGTILHFESTARPG